MMASFAARRAIFLDRDGVLNVDTGYPHRPEELLLVPGAALALALFKSRGYLTVVVTNQAGVARGLYDESAIWRFHEALQERLARQLTEEQVDIEEGMRDGVPLIDAFYYAPWHPQAVVPAYRVDHPDRKPAPGMLLRAIRDWNIDPATSLMIGDRETDMQAAQAAEVRGFLFQEENLYKFATKLPLFGTSDPLLFPSS